MDSFDWAMAMLAGMALSSFSVPSASPNQWRVMSDGASAANVVVLPSQNIKIFLPPELSGTTLAQVTEKDRLNVLEAALPAGQTEFKFILTQGDERYTITQTPEQMITLIKQAQELDNTTTRISFTKTLDQERREDTLTVTQR